ncbi:hypothetical protein K402DRAFT_391426 [Aulographum hederae CBS 113979]|uniref:Uncharacterized protein n=1 Tax=Aulographum hederae CBS 113979 TaxID=1176131 RepID=A0A6G1H6M7_9PEZI|nr:hypothetical protein K402DRAFT_391426 [Aulographum hederae CBS 113979]
MFTGSGSSGGFGSPISRKPVNHKENFKPKTVDEDDFTLQSILETEPPFEYSVQDQAAPPYTNTQDPVNSARDKYFQDMQKQHKLRQRPSFIFSSWTKRSRSESAPQPAPTEFVGANATYTNVKMADPDFKPAPETVEKEESKKTRNITNSLRNKFKHVFRKSSTETKELPVQQIGASRPYFGELSSRTPSDAHANIDNVPSPNEELLSRHSSRTNSRPSSRQMLRPSSRAGSNRSRAPSSTRSSHNNDAASNIGSRVTSWTDSTVTNTATSRVSKRLSVIHEMSRPNLLHSSRQSLGRRVSKLFLGQGKSSPVAEEEVPEDYFSLKKLDSSPPAATVRSRSPGAADMELSLSLPRARGAVEGAKSTGSNSLMSWGRNVAHTTIRAVTPESISRSRRTSTSFTTEYPRPFTPIDVEDAHDEVSMRKPSSTRKTSGNKLRKPFKRGNKAPAPTPEQLAARGERANERWKSPLEDKRSLFFPRSGRNVGASPSRGARLGNESADYDDMMRRVELSHGAAGNEDATVTAAVKADLEAARNVISPSIYSHYPEDYQSLHANDSGVSLPLPLHQRLDIQPPTNPPTFPPPAITTGTALITPSQPVASYPLASSSPPKRRQQSRDWKAWLSKEIGELEALGQSALGIKIEGGEYFPRSGKGGPKAHVRERAQIGSEDVGVGVGVTSSGRIAGTGIAASAGTKAPLREISPALTSNSINSSPVPGQGTADPATKPRRPSLASSRPSSRMNERFPMLETGRSKSSLSSVRSQSRNETQGRASSALSQGTGAGTGRGRTPSPLSISLSGMEGREGFNTQTLTRELGPSYLKEKEREKENQNPIAPTPASASASTSSSSTPSSIQRTIAGSRDTLEVPKTDYQRRMRRPSRRARAETSPAARSGAVVGEREGGATFSHHGSAHGGVGRPHSALDLRSPTPSTAVGVASGDGVGGGMNTTNIRRKPVLSPSPGPGSTNSNTTPNTTSNPPATTLFEDRTLQMIRKGPYAGVRSGVEQAATSTYTSTSTSASASISTSTGYATGNGYGYGSRHHHLRTSRSNIGTYSSSAFTPPSFSNINEPPSPLTPSELFLPVQRGCGGGGGDVSPVPSPGSTTATVGYSGGGVGGGYGGKKENSPLRNSGAGNLKDTGGKKMADAFLMMRRRGGGARDGSERMGEKSPSMSPGLAFL